METTGDEAGRLLTIGDIMTVERIPTASLERYMQISMDLKKKYHYVKDTGKWFWSDGDATDITDWVGPFTTFFDALCDVVEPYITDSDD
jgi:hypothetical protein